MIGFDIGTTYSKAAYVSPAGRPTSVLDDRGQTQTPSVVYVPQNGKPLVGVDAREQGYVEPKSCARLFKLKLGTQDSVVANGAEFNATDATAAVVAYLKQCAEQAIGKAIVECVATHPANFLDNSKQALGEAFERNGIKVLKLMPEPTAAGIAHAIEAARTKARFIVFDYGGGTFDASVLAVEGSQITVLSTEGVPELGGNDLNKPIEDDILAEIQRKFGDQPTRSSDPLLFQEIDVKAEATKISLSNRAKVLCVVGYRGSQIVLEFLQEDYNHRIEPMVRPSLEAMDRAVQGAALSYGSIDYVIMVGGASRSPVIRDLVAKHTGLQLKTDIDPERAVAYGAALACVAHMATEGRTGTIRGQMIPDPAIFIRDVTAHGVGCCVLDTSQGRKRLTNAVLIPQNTPIPCRKVDHFYLEHDQQVECRIEILQGSADAERDDCLLIGELVLDNLPRESKRTQRIQVEYIIDVNGMVTATATDKVSGKSVSVSVDYKKGIKPKDKPAAA